MMMMRIIIITDTFALKNCFKIIKVTVVLNIKCTQNQYLILILDALVVESRRWGLFWPLSLTLYEAMADWLSFSQSFLLICNFLPLIWFISLMFSNYFWILTWKVLNKYCYLLLGLEVDIYCDFHRDNTFKDFQVL